MTTKKLILTALQPAAVTVAPMTIALPSPRVVRMSWDATDAVMPDVADEAKVFVLIQEGGSSAELYIHAHGSRGEAEDDRLSCENDGAYRTSEIIEVPATLANVAGFYELAEQLVCAVAELRSPFTDRKASEIVVPANVAAHANFAGVAKQLVAAVETIGFPEGA